MTKEEKYNAIYEAMEEIISNWDPCGIIDGKCIAHRQGHIKADTCCKTCKKLGQHGCTGKILGCKFYFCGIASRNIPTEIEQKIEALRYRAEQAGFHLIISTEQKY